MVENGRRAGQKSDFQDIARDTSLLGSGDFANHGSPNGRTHEQLDIILRKKGADPVGGNRKTMQEMVRESIGIAKDPSIFQSYSDFLPETRWLPKAEYEAKKQEEQAQMCLGHSDEQVKLEKLMLPFAAHFLFNSYLGDLGHYQDVKYHTKYIYQRKFS